MERSKRYSILVLCTGNSCRSQIAEGFFRSFGDIRIDVKSAGLTTHGLNPLAVKTMAEIGIDISAQRSESLTDYIEQSFDYIITVCDNASENCPVFPGKSERLHWPFEDPAGAVGSESEKLLIFGKIRDQIGEQITLFLKEID